MPNRPALIGAGITAACTGPGVSETERARAEWVLAAAGPVVWLDDESQMDAVTAVSGSGPAYFFLLIEAIEDAGTALGLPRETARRLAVQTALGSARMAAEGTDPPERLREQVTSTGRHDRRGARRAGVGGPAWYFCARDRRGGAPLGRARGSIRYRLNPCKP